MNYRLNMFCKHLNICRKIHTTSWNFRKQSWTNETTFFGTISLFASFGFATFYWPVVDSYHCKLDQGFAWLWEISGILVDSPCLHRYQLPFQLLVNTYIFRFETLTKIPYHQSGVKRWRNLWEQVKPSKKQCDGTISDSSVLFYIKTAACRLCLRPQWTYRISQHWKGMEFAHLFLLTIISLCIGNMILTNEIGHRDDRTIIKPDTKNKTIFLLNWWMVLRPKCFISFSVGSLQLLDLSWGKVPTAKIAWSFNCNINSALVNTLSKKTLCSLGWRLLTRRITTFSLSPNIYWDWMFSDVPLVPLPPRISNSYT